MARQPGTRLAHRLRKHSPRPARGFFMPKQPQEEALDDYIAELLAVAPPLTDERRATIAALLTTQETPTAAATAIGA